MGPQHATQAINLKGHVQRVFGYAFVAFRGLRWLLCVATRPPQTHKHKQNQTTLKHSLYPPKPKPCWNQRSWRRKFPNTQQHKRCIQIRSTAASIPPPPAALAGWSKPSHCRGLPPTETMLRQVACPRLASPPQLRASDKPKQCGQTGCCTS